MPPTRAAHGARASRRRWTRRSPGSASASERDRSQALRLGALLRGKPVIRGTRVPVHLVVGRLATGASIEEVAAAYGSTDEQVRACPALAAEIFSEKGFLALSRG
ncbi:DUF433 domain-containing protein [Geochorda subterranea]|uniref:DUF433 domain-containing protein n=1 Tax=Geochorda subterranea TaxID=3109564 RepID=UPI0038602908